MLEFLLVAFILMSVMLSAAIGGGRFYLQYTTSGRTFRRSHYGAWVEELFAGLSTAGFSLLAFIPLGRGIAYLAQDNTESPYVIGICLIALFACFYCRAILMIAKRCENDYRRLKVQNYVLPYRLQNGKKIVEAEDILAIIERASRTMSQHVVAGTDAEVDIIDSTTPAEMKRIERSTRSRWLKIKASRRHRGWGIVRQTEPYTVIGNLALDDEKSPVGEIEPQSESAALPIVNLKPTPEKLLELQLATLPEADRKLVEQLFSDEPVLRRWVMAPNCTVRLSIVPETDQAPRHIRIRGVVFQRRV